MNLLSTLVPPPRDADTLRRMTDARLRELVAHAWRHSAHFRRGCEASGIAPSDIAGAADLPRLPLLTRRIIRGNLRELTDDRVDPATCGTMRTSGTSGEALVLPTTAAEVRLAHAIWFSTYMRCGARPWHRQAKFLGDTSGPHRKWFFQRLGIFRRDYASASAPTREKIRWLRETKPDVLFAWGSILNEMAAVLEADGERLNIPLAVSSSESVLHGLVTERITPRLVDLYGSIEGTAYSVPCPRGRGHHLDTRWNIIELLDDANRPAASGRIVVTCLWRRTLPLIRYELGDLGTWAKESCGCGNPMPLLASLDGRVADLFELSDGNQFGHGVLVVVMNDSVGIRQYQIVQPAPSEIIFHIVTTADFPADGETRIRRGVDQAFGGKLRVAIHRTRTIPQIPGQKLRSIVTKQHLAQMRAQGLDVAAFLAT